MPKVFISYRQLNDTQRQRVRDFGDRIRACGVEVVLDQFYKDAHPGGPPEGWPKWSSDQAIHTEKVLIIGNEPWFLCFDGKENPGVGLGAACEAGMVRQRLYDQGGLNEIIRVAYFDKADVAGIPMGLKRYDRFHAVDHFADLIAWLGGTLPLVAAGTSPMTATATSSTITWPVRSAGFALDMANREVEFDFFAGTLCDPNSKRATLISAGSGPGKTRLVTEFHRYGAEVSGANRCCLIDFKSNGTTDYLLDCLANDLDGPFASRSEATLRSSLRKASEPLLLVIDTFERAPQDTRAFVEANILNDLRAAPAVRVLLAGQPKDFPDPAVNAWGSQAKRFDLANIPDPTPWIEWARRFGNVTEDMVRHIVAATRGVPNTTASLIENLGGYTRAEFNQMGIQ